VDEGAVDSVDIRDYLRVLRAGWVLLILGLVLGAGTAVGVSLLRTPLYTAHTELLVVTTGSDDLASAVQGSQYTEQKVASYAKLLTSRDLIAAVVDDLGLAYDPDALIARVETTVVTDTTIIDVSVTDPSPQRALAITESLNEQFQATVTELETPTGETTSRVRVKVIATPELPESPSSPALVPNAILGAVLGLVLAVAVAVLRDRLDTTVKEDAVANEVTGAPVIGHIPDDAGLATAHLTEAHSNSSAAEAVRQVRTNLSFLAVDHPPRVIMVTSSISSEGKTTTALNLALALAEQGNNVTLVEADLRRPKLTRYLGLVEGAGLTNVLTRAAPLDTVVQEVGGPELQVLPSGPVPPNPSELLASEAMARLVETLLAERDIVVIDAPPLLPVADAGAIAGLVDGVLLCARWGTVTSDELARSAETIARLGADVLGVVMTMVPARSAPVAYGYTPDDDRSERAGRLGRLFGRRRAVGVEQRPIARVRPRTSARVQDARRPAEPSGPRAAGPITGPQRLPSASGRQRPTG
jgi:capsular exopolysaccharide synthesis family protein